MVVSLYLKCLIYFYSRERNAGGDDGLAFHFLSPGALKVRKYTNVGNALVKRRIDHEPRG